MHAVAYYRLKRGYGDNAKDLLDKKVYIYPAKGSKACNTATDCMCADGDSFSQQQHTKPYSHGIFLAILTDTIFKRDNSTAYRLRDQFFSSLEDVKDKFEIAKPMLAYIATGVYGIPISRFNESIADITYRYTWSFRNGRLACTKQSPSLHFRSQLFIRSTYWPSTPFNISNQDRITRPCIASSNQLSMDLCIHIRFLAYLYNTGTMLAKTVTLTI